MNVKLKEEFTQVCVWPACIVVVDEKTKQSKIDEFEKLMLDKLGTRVQYLEEIKTKPDTNEIHQNIEGTGDRNDLFFAVHKDDVGHFAIPRLQIGIRWIEDVLASDNYRCHIYPNRVFKYVSWNKEYISFPSMIKT
jgi:hypothetical protein